MPRLAVVVALHWFTGNGVAACNFFGLWNTANRFVFACPNGHMDSLGRRFWDATDACCNAFGPAVDDVTYLRHLISQMIDEFHGDAHRVVLVGLSNGAFMAHRMLCDASDIVTHVIAVNGVTWNDASACPYTGNMPHVLQVSSTDDNIVLYEGGNGGYIFGPYPSAPTTVERLVERGNCTGFIHDALDVSNVATVSHYECKTGSVRFASVHGGHCVQVAGLIEAVLSHTNTSSRRRLVNQLSFP